MNHPLDGICAIWGTPAETGRSAAFIWQCSSDRTGGGYLIDILAFNQIPLEDRGFRARLTTWLIDQRRAGEQWPEITAEVLGRVARQPNLRLSDRIERFFLYLSSLRFRPGNRFYLRGEISRADAFAAWTESMDEPDTSSLMALLVSMGLVENVGQTEYTLTPDGFARLESVDVRGGSNAQCFVAMWFGTEMDDAYDQGFALGIADTGYQPVRIDRKEHANKIDDEIVAEIRRSHFIVADFTCPTVQTTDGQTVPIPRGGVYYEAGLAQGLGLPVIWTVRQDCIDYVHFDTRQFAHILWSDPTDLRARLRYRIEAILGRRT